MKKEYVTPDMQIEGFLAEEMITASGTGAPEESVVVNSQSPVEGLGMTDVTYEKFFSGE